MPGAVNAALKKTGQHPHQLGACVLAGEVDSNTRISERRGRGKDRRQMERGEAEGEMKRHRD